MRSVMNNVPEKFDPDSIVEQVLGGEKDRFRLLVREYGLLVRGYLAARVYHLEDAEDLAGSLSRRLFQTLDL